MRIGREEMRVRAEADRAEEKGMNKICTADTKIKIPRKNSQKKFAPGGSYSGEVRVLCVADKEAVQMRRTLEDLYYGNLRPCEQRIGAGSELRRAVDIIT